MSDMTTNQRDQRLTELLDLVLELAKGNLDARVEPSDVGDDVDLLATGLSMLAEELSAAIASERTLRANLETKVAERTAELEEKMRTIAAQRETIIELSTPVLSIWDEVLLLPLVGVIDSARASQMTAQLLEECARQNASVTIIDVTGVPVIDTAVATHLIGAIKALELLGATAILTGVSPATAQTLTRVGIDASDLPAAGSLKVGLQQALHRVKN